MSRSSKGADVVLAPNTDPIPLPYGALNSYQLHFIVECKTPDTDRFLAKCKPITKGWFKDKRVTDVKWIGASSFSDSLQKDSRLTEMLKEILLHEGEIRVDPVANHVRIYGKWHNEYETRFNRSMAEVADLIAGHIKSMLGETS